MKKKTKAISILLTGVALAIGIAVSNGIIQNAYHLDEVRATNSSVTISASSMGGVTNLKGGNYSAGAERTATISDISFGGKAITANNANSPSSGSTAGQYIQTQSSNGVIYNTAAFPGKIVSVVITKNSTSSITLHCGSTSRLVNNTAGNYIVSGGEEISSQTSASITWNLDAATNYTYFAVKNGSSTSYISSIVVTYQASEPRTLTGISVSGEPVTKTYSSGEVFNPTGITVTASFSDSADANVTNECSYTPNPLVQGTTTVTASFTEGSITKTALISGITVIASPTTKIVGFGSDAEDNGWTENTNNTSPSYIGIATSSNYVSTTALGLFGLGNILDSNLTITFMLGSYGGTGVQGVLAVALLDESQNVLSIGTGNTNLSSSTPSYAQGPTISVSKPSNPANINSIKIYLSDVGGFTTQKYVRLAEITLQYQVRLLLEVNEDAVAYGTSFLSATADGCSTANSSTLSGVWASLESSYNALSNDAKAYLTGLTPNVSGNDAQHAVARYIHIITKYGEATFNDFMNLDLQSAPSSSDVLALDSHDFLPLIAVISVVGLTILIGYYYHNKRKEA